MEVFKDQSRLRSWVAGRRAGKTYESQLELLRAVNEPLQTVVYLSPTRLMTKRLMFEPLQALLNKINCRTEVNKSEMSIRFTNGSNLYLGGAYNYNTYRGMGINFVVFDEAADIEHEAWQEVISPALADKEGKALIIGTPKGKSNWFYDITNTDEFSTHICTTLEGGWVTLQEIESQRRLLDEKTFRQEFEASFETTGSNVYYAFTDENIIDIDYNPLMDSYLCFDFNTGERPMSVILVQGMNVTKEFVYKNSNTEGTCEAIDNFLQSTGFVGKLEITGDSSGHASKSSASVSDYAIIEKYFKNYKGYTRRTRATRRIRDRVAALNSLLRSADGNIRLKIDRRCTKLIDDLRRVEWKENGTQLDDRNVERTHPTDALSYFAYNYYPIERDRKVTVI